MLTTGFYPSDELKALSGTKMVRIIYWGTVVTKMDKKFMPESIIGGIVFEYGSTKHRLNIDSNGELKITKLT